MRYRQLGASDLRVSEIALGSWLTYSGGVETQAAEACVDKAFDVGINFIDTANVYGAGAAETFLGEALSGRPRDSYVLATKLFFPMSDADRGLSREQVRKQLDASLQRLRTDYIDLYQCHRYDEAAPLEETMAALSEAVASGKVRWLGFSEWPVDKIQAGMEMADVTRFVSSQPQYSLLWRAPEREVIPYCAAHGVSQIVWSPLAQGVLTGKYRPGDPPPPDSRAANPEMNAFLGRRMMAEPLLAAVQTFSTLAERNGFTAAQLALAWVLREPNVASAIIGASRPEQVEINASASGLPVDPALLDEIDRLLAPYALG